MLDLPAPGPELVLSYGDLPEHVVDVRFGSADRPLVVLVHGGFWRPEYDRLHLRPLADALAREGWSSAAIEYRRVPGDPDATVDDVASAIRTVSVAEELAGRSNGRLVLVGHSAGGHLVAHAAVDPLPQVVGVVPLAPVVDLALGEELGLGDGAVRAFLGGPAAGRPDLDPVRLPEPRVPVTVVHGTADEIVPLALAESYARRHPQVRVRPVDGGHFAVIDPRSTAWPALLEALDAR